MVSDRRYSARYDVFLIVEFRPAESTAAYTQGVTENISSEGLSFDSADHDSRVTDVLELQLKTPDGGLSLSVPGEVIWKRELWYKCVTGIKFRDVNKDTERKIAELVAAAREKHAGSSVDDREEKDAGIHKEAKEPAAGPDSGQGRKSQGSDVKDNSNAASTILESIDKVIDKAESEDRRKDEEIDNIKAPDVNRTENNDSKLQDYTKPMTFYRAPVKEKGRGLKRLLLVSLGVICMIAAVAALSVRFAPVRQPLITDISTEDSVPSQNAGEGHAYSTGEDISHEDIITPAEPVRGHEISDINNELPEEVKAEGPEPAPASPAVSQKVEDRPQHLAVVDNIQSDIPPRAEVSLPVSKLQVTIIFDKNSDVVNPWFFPEIDKISNALFNYPGSKVMVTGHTDSVGLTSYNMDLSVRRAAAVQDLLVQKGIERSRIETAGLGYSRPAHSNDTEKGRIRNRRVELEIIPSARQVND